MKAPTPAPASTLAPSANPRERTEAIANWHTATCKNAQAAHLHVIGVSPPSRVSYQTCANMVYPTIAACGHGKALGGPHPATGGALAQNQIKAQQASVVPVNPYENSLVVVLPCAKCTAEAIAQSQSGASTATDIKPVPTPSGAWQFWTTYLLA
jgi:hypothetical protein